MNTIIRDFLTTLGMEALLLFLSDNAKLDTKTLTITDGANVVKLNPTSAGTYCSKGNETYFFAMDNRDYCNPIEEIVQECGYELWFNIPEGKQLAYKAVTGHMLGIDDPDELDRLINQEKRFIKDVSNPEVFCNDREWKITDAKEKIVKLEKMKDELINWSDGHKELMENIDKDLEEELEQLLELGYDPLCWMYPDD